MEKKELQEKIYKLEFEKNSKLIDQEKRAFRDQSDELRKLESLLREK